MESEIWPAGFNPGTLYQKQDIKNTYKCRVGQNRIYTPYMIIFLGKYHMYTVYICGSGQPYV
jgi:hypothetical protein